MLLQTVNSSYQAEVIPLYKAQALEKTTDTSYISNFEKTPFIVANTLDVSLSHLHHDCLIPVFAKDNEKTISHQEFIQIALKCAQSVYGRVSLDNPEVRVSHQIRGRIPDAIHKNVAELLEHEKTVYYERMAFIARIPSIIEIIDGNPLMLTIGGVRSYNSSNLYNKKSFEKFRFFIGFQNLVCCNMCVSTDGSLEEIRVSSIQELHHKILEVIQNYHLDNHLKNMRQLTEHALTETQFAQLIGRSRMYQHLSKEERKNIPMLSFNDGQITSVVKDYYEDKSFARDSNGDINLWKMYNLFTHANKSSYIDSFVDRNINAFELSSGVMDAIQNPQSSYSWFLK